MSRVDSLEINSPDDVLRLLLTKRGIVTEEAIDAFLNPSFEVHTHDPFLLSGMREAVQRIFAALQKQETIGIFADYDCDGVPAAVVLYDFFKRIGHESVHVYIPHRNKEGFGVNTQGIDVLSEKGATLIVTVDCGISDAEAIAYAREKHIDVIVTDHHLEGEMRPDACAILNPNKKGDTYPFKGLCGAGVAFKLVQALIAENKKQQIFSLPEGFEKWLLDMVGLATLADMVPLVDENRVFAHFGLVVLRKSRRPGLVHLLRKLRITQRFLTEDDIGFMVAPRLNAASRMGHAMDAFLLLTTKDEQEAGALAQHLDHINNERKGIVAAMTKEVKKRLHERPEIPSVIVVGDPRWMPSLLGLAAHAIAEEYQRPVFLWGREGGEVIKGSCRSEGKTNLAKLMNSAKDAFLECGGHEFSGGFSLSHEQVHTLEQVLCDAHAAQQSQKKEEVEVTQSVDGELPLSMLSPELYATIEKLAPFGVGNAKPLFRFPESTVANVRQFGKTNNHLEILLSRANGAPVKVIQFFATPERFPIRLEKGSVVSVCAVPEASYFLGKKELRLRLVSVAA